MSPLFGFVLAAVLLFCLIIIRVPGALRRAEGQRAAAPVDPRHPGPHLHAGELLPRLQRRSEGHGPDHADPDRHRADRLRAQPRAAETAGGQTVRLEVESGAARVIEHKAAGYNVTGNPRARGNHLCLQSHHSTKVPFRRWPRWCATSQPGPRSTGRSPRSRRSCRQSRNDMYLASEAIRFLMKDNASELSPEEIKTLNAYKARSTTRPNSFRPGSRSRWRSRSASAR